MKYIDADRLRAKIERRLDELNPKTGMFGDRPLRAVNPKTFPRERELEKVLDLIDSLQQEQPSEDLEDEIKKFFRSRYHGVMNFGELNGHYLDNETIRMLVKLGAGWQKEQMMREAKDAEIGYWNQRGLSIRTEQSIERMPFKEGDWVKIILLKED